MNDAQWNKITYVLVRPITRAKIAQRYVRIFLIFGSSRVIRFHRRNSLTDAANIGRRCGRHRENCGTDCGRDFGRHSRQRGDVLHDGAK